MHRALTLFAFLVLLVAVTSNQKAAAKYPPILRFGSQGPEISNLQYRLNTLGYLHVSPTGKFRKLTRKALQDFQKEHGLRSSGFADLATWRALKKRSLSKKELSLLAHIIYGEARGETYMGQVAVGAVVMNRLHSPLFPKTLRGVVLERNAFTAVQDGQFRLNPDPTAFKAAKAAVKGSDPTGNALFYYNPVICKSAWFESRVSTKRIGHHLFKI
jgi:N-acetylmuramoyl-L-alanine amidase